MRNPERLDSFYNELATIHKRSFPDWRFGQFVHNVTMWLSLNKGVDVFFPEEEKMLGYIREFEKEFTSLF